jgi:protein-disulfide isomerase
MKIALRAMTIALVWTLAALAPVVVVADDGDKVAEYFRKKANLPPSVTAKVADVKDSKIKGAKEGVLEMTSGANNQKQPFLMSNDGRYVVFAAVEDITVNPFEAVAKKISLKDRPSRGPADAKVTIVEYSDFQCPFCSRGYSTLENEVMKEYEGKVRVVFKNFPLQSIHPWAEPAAVAAECAFKQNPEAFWKVYNYLFQNQKDITAQNLKEKVLTAVGDGVDKAALTDCIDNQKTLAQVKADQQEGTTVGVNGTPAFLINGRLLSGAQPAAQFKAIIDDELASKK